MPTHTIPSVRFADGTAAPALGLGTWHMGERRGNRAAEVAAIRKGLDLGMTLIDTAEMYGDGGAETMLGEAIAGRRDEIFLVSKVYPHNAGAKAAIAACERSLARLRTDRLDLYLLHWRGRVPLSETAAAFERLRAQGKILRWGVSNFDAPAMAELVRARGGEACATNQVLYHLDQRGVEWDLLPWMRTRRMPSMAYSPLAQGALATHPRLAAIAGRIGCTATQLALAWLVAQRDVIVIPKANSIAHVRANRAAADVRIDAETRRALDAAFPPPAGARPLAII
jgi:diketogulonate reductase-like aldo/keto reductase